MACSRCLEHGCSDVLPLCWWQKFVESDVPELEAQGRLLRLVRDARKNLISPPERTFEHLVGQMVDE